MRKTIIQTIRELRLDSQTYYGRFLVGPLPQNAAVVFGTTIRRVLFNLQGPVITAVSIRNLKHEFDSLHGVSESTSEILANLSKVRIGDTGLYNRLTYENDSFCHDSQILRISYNGPGILRAKDLKLSLPLFIVDPNQYIATLKTEVTLELLLLVQSAGKQVESTAFPMPTFLLKKANTVVSNVNLNIVDLNNEREEALVLEIWTNGTISPSRALRLTGSMVCSFFKYFLRFDSQI